MTKKEYNTLYRQKNGEKVRQQQREHYYKHKEVYKTRARYWKYKISNEEYEQLLISQNYLCAICAKHQQDLDRALSIDHEHESGNIRGLLCRTCNAGLGQFYDNADYLQAAAKYLIEKRRK